MSQRLADKDAWLKLFINISLAPNHANKNNITGVEDYEGGCKVETDLRLNVHVTDSPIAYKKDNQETDTYRQVPAEQ